MPKGVTATNEGIALFVDNIVKEMPRELLFL
jgi:hypothetical protein